MQQKQRKQHVGQVDLINWGELLIYHEASNKSSNHKAWRIIHCIWTCICTFHMPFDLPSSHMHMHGYMWSMIYALSAGSVQKVKKNRSNFPRFSSKKWTSHTDMQRRRDTQQTQDRRSTEAIFVDPMFNCQNLTVHNSTNAATYVARGPCRHGYGMSPCKP